MATPKPPPCPPVPPVNKPVSYTHLDVYKRQIVIGGYGFAHGEPGAKKALAGVAAGTGIAVLAVNVLSWLWGV